MEDKHLNTILERESDELIKSSIEDLVHTPSESDGISKSECDFPVCDDSSPKKDEVLDDIISIPPGYGNDHFNAGSSLIEFVLNRDNDKHGLPPTKRLFKVTKLDPSPNTLVLGEGLEIWDNHGWYVPSKVVLESMTVHLEVWPVGLR
ncbi:hypothetical protein Tco_1380048 [Tanacetum coccineum]